MTTIALKTAIKLKHFTHVDEVLDCLHTYAVHEHINFLSIWRVPQRPTDPHTWQLKQNTFFDPDVPRGFREDFLANHGRRGPSIMLLLASQTLAPFTFTEAMRLTRPKGEERWVFNLLGKYGIRDGFYCPAGHWMVAFWSKSVLKLSSSSRTNIYFVAQQAAFRLEELMGRRIRKIENIKPLTPRELAVVRGLRLGSKPMQIAADLGLSVPTVRTFLTRAMRKLEARTPEQAVGEAMARMLLR